jgi:hypothetical protein
MKLLTTDMPLDTRDACVSYGGLVDRETACARDVALWGDAESIESVERAAAAEQVRERDWHAA